MDTFKIKHSLSIDDLSLKFISPIESIVKFPEYSKPSNFTLTSNFLWLVRHRGFCDLAIYLV